MASSPSGDRTKKTQGIRIDSSLISTASGGEVQNELEGLGVSVFDQGTFEEGVIKQLDEEVSRRAAEQRRKFLIKDYAQVQVEKNTLRRELEALSRKIASLLSRPLCDVILSLREMKSAQEQKRKQIFQLEVRERELVRLISGKDGSNGEATTGEGGGVVNDAMFAVPSSSSSSSSWSSEQQKLIQSGHMTPFGTSELTTPPPSEQERSDNHVSWSQDSDVGTALTSSSLPSGSGLRLCSEGFDGLFENLAPSPRKVVKKKGQVSPEEEKKKTKKGKEKKRVHLVGDNGDVGDNGEGCAVGDNGVVGDGCEGGEGEWVPTREEVEAMEREMIEDNDWQEEKEDEGSTEYTTDEELGADHVLGRKKVKRKRRPLSSGESEDGEEEEGGRLGRRKRRRRISQSNHHLDDGDEELYRLRMRECEVTDDPTTSDKIIDGRLRIPSSIWSRLYGYQCTGVHWLWELHCQQCGGVVGDEMGLGKTIEMIAFLTGLRVSRLRSHVTRELGLGPVLVVCPATVMHQWVAEFHTWWAPFRVAILHDTGTYSGGPKSALVADIINCGGVLVTTYAGVRIYRDHLLPCKWDYVILDEGHKIRNPDTEVTLVCKQFASPHRIILSGSPMQNNLKELWSLFDFVFPGKLGTLPVFMEQFSVPITLGGYSNATQVQVQTAYKCACILRETINPYLLRRLKADVKIQLPSKNEQVLFCKLTQYQQELYEDYVTGPDVAAMMVGRKKIFTGLAVLRKLCNHPDLVTNDYRESATNGREEREEEEDKDETAFIRSRKPQRRRRRRLSTRSSETEREGERRYREEEFGWGKRSGKMIVVEALLKMWCEQKHRVLLFSQSKLMLNVLELMVVAKGYSYVRMDGDTPIKVRQPLIRQFNETPSIFVFLLTTRVGGVGVNLTGADRIIIYDPDWNPSTDTQARERAWRIGQKRQVTIYRLLTSGTIEEKIYHRQIFKQFLSNRVLKDPKQRRFFKANGLYELFSLGQVHPKGGTETSAIFAGTGSEVIPKKQKKKKRRRQRSCDLIEESCDSGSKSCDFGGGSRDHQRGGVGEAQKKHRQFQVLESAPVLSSSSSRLGNDGGGGDDVTVVGALTAISGGSEEGKEEGECRREVTENIVVSGEVIAVKEGAQDEVTGECRSIVEPLLTGSDDLAGQNRQDDVSNGQNEEQKDNEKERPDQSPVLSSTTLDHTQSGKEGRECREKSRHHKKKKKKKHRRRLVAAEVEGVEIAGVEKKRMHRPQGEGEKTSNHDDYILTKLFRKSAVHSAIQHDSIMSSASGDYVVIENEAKKVAQSAARALRESRRRCLSSGGRGGGGGGGGGGWGQLTWTGQHGSAGSGSRLQPRFGAKTAQMAPKGSNLEQSKLFDGQKAGTSLLPSPQKQQQKASSSTSITSSTSLLSAMRSRNSHSLPQYAVKDVHKSAHDNLMREIRDFIATRCKFDGQATTDELLGHFLSRLPNSDTATFRSMLREICDFSRVNGEGRWFLKSQFR